MTAPRQISRPSPHANPRRTVANAVLVLCAMVAAGLMTTGCASLVDAGHSSYTVTRGANGYEFATQDGKEYAAGRQVQFQTIDGAATLTITEGKSTAFRGQAIAAKAAAVFPITDLANIITGP